MNKSRSNLSGLSLDGRLWHPLFLGKHAAKLKAGDAESVLAWLDECGVELQADVDSVRLTFPDETPAFGVEELRRCISASAEDSATLSRLADEMIALDAAIRSTDNQVAEAFSDDLLTGDYTLEEIAELALKRFGKRRGEGKKQTPR